MVNRGFILLKERPGLQGGETVLTKISCGPGLILLSGKRKENICLVGSKRGGGVFASRDIF